MLGLALLGCGGDDDPCADIAGRCVTVHVRATTFDAIDRLELDVLYADRHGTTATQPADGRSIGLPATTAIAIDHASAGALRVGVVAAGKLGDTVLGTGAATALIDPNSHASITIELTTAAACTAGADYCGGSELAGDPDTLYRCDPAGVPRARGYCGGGCITRSGDDVCRGVGGPCLDLGKYCGGNALDGDPSTVYVCMNGVGTVFQECADGCVIAPPLEPDVCR